MLRDRFVALEVSSVEADAPVVGAVRSASLGQLEVASVQSVDQRIVRSERLIGSDGRDVLQIGMVRRGRAHVVQDGREVTLGRCGYVLYDASRPFVWELAGDARGVWELDVFTWPRARLGFGETDVRSLTAIGFDGRNGPSALVGRLLRGLIALNDADEVPRAVLDEVDAMVHAVLSGGHARSPAPHTDLLRRAVGLIDERLADPGLAPAELAAALAVSVRQLHRLFADHDATVSRTIRLRRLERCRRDIAADPRAVRSLQQIAYDWGFSDLSVFSRTFKQQYGMSPSRYRATVAGEL